MHKTTQTFYLNMTDIHVYYTVVFCTNVAAYSAMRHDLLKWLESLLCNAWHSMSTTNMQGQNISQIFYLKIFHISMFSSFNVYMSVQLQGKKHYCGLYLICFLVNPPVIKYDTHNCLEKIDVAFSVYFGPGAYWSSSHCRSLELE